MPASPDRRREARLRGSARRQGFAVHKDRAKAFGVDHQGGYMLVDADRNMIVSGERYDLSLEDLESFLQS